MATSNSTHWSKYPSACTPVAENTYSTQLQSPLFRLPRELRDEIYEYYASGRRSYEYNKDTHKLRYRDASARTENLGLLATCKIAAREMGQIAFQKAEFSTRRSAYDGSEFEEVHSKAARFHYLTRLVQTQRQRMLVCVAELLHPSDFDEIDAGHPYMGTFFGNILQEAVARQSDKLRLEMPVILENDTVSETFVNALRFALVLADRRDPDKFARLTDKVFGPGICPIERNLERCNLFIQGCHSEILSWRPDPWWVPHDKDLLQMEAMLYLTRDHQPPYHMDCDVDYYCKENTKYYFSAAAVAIDYLQSLPPKQRPNLRKIVLKEDRVSLNRAACHSRGLIPFCRSSPTLRISQHIGLFDSLLPRITERPRRRPYITGRQCLTAIIPWIEETMSLPTYGMPPGAYQLIIDGSTNEAAQVFDTIKYAAALQEAMLGQARQNGVQPTSWLQENGRYDTFPLPWHLPAGLPETVREMVNGTSNIRFTGPVGDLWDADLMSMKVKDWSQRDWRIEWDNKVLFRSIETSMYADMWAWYGFQPW